MNQLILKCINDARPSTRISYFFVGILGFLMIGCGSQDGSTSWEVSGTVLFDMQPVPSGRVVFDPDASLGNSGRQGVGFIHNGTYRTEKGWGVGEGPYIVYVYGSQKTDGPEAGASLFPPYRATVSLPAGPSEQNFHVSSK